jgi:hypothetical protein
VALRWWRAASPALFPTALLCRNADEFQLPIVEAQGAPEAPSSSCVRRSTCLPGVTFKFRWNW